MKTESKSFAIVPYGNRLLEIQDEQRRIATVHPKKDLTPNYEIARLIAKAPLLDKCKTLLEDIVIARINHLDPDHFYNALEDICVNAKQLLAKLEKE